MRFAATRFAPALIALAITPATWAQVNISLDNVDNSAQLTGYITQDLKVDTDNDWTSAAMVLELDEGTIYQDGFGNDVEPNPFLLTYYPSLEFDTYMTGGGTWGVGVLGSGGDAGGHTQEFSTSRLDASWKSNGSTETGITTIARITLSDDATGRWRLAAMQDDDEHRYDFSGTIVDGVMTIDP